MSNLDLLYLFGFSSNKSNQLKRLKKLLNNHLANNKTVGIALLHDGVIGLSTKGFTPESLTELLNSSFHVFALKPDLDARGISKDVINENVNLIEYEELVDLMDSTPRIISWM
jgi:sulfur relay protein TusB/DsrH